MSVNGRKRHAAVFRGSILIVAVLGVMGRGISQEQRPLMLIGNPFPRAGSPPVFSAGFRVGLTDVAMGDVNDALRESAGIFRAGGAVVPPADQLGGGLYIEGNVRVTFERFDVGILVSTVAVDAAIAFDDGTASLDEEYDVRTTEILGTFNWRLTLRRDVAVVVGAGGGYAIASGEYHSRFLDYFDPAANENIVHELKKDYVAARVSAGVQLALPFGFLELTGGYRLSDAGVPEGPVTRNGVRMTEEPRRNRRGMEMELNYSGLFASGGVSVAF